MCYYKSTKKLSNKSRKYSLFDYYVESGEQDKNIKELDKLKIVDNEIYMKLYKLRYKNYKKENNYFCN